MNKFRNSSRTLSEARYTAGAIAPPRWDSVSQFPTFAKLIDWGIMFSSHKITFSWNFPIFISCCLRSHFRSGNRQLGICFRHSWTLWKTTIANALTYEQEKSRIRWKNSARNVSYIIRFYRHMGDDNWEMRRGWNIVQYFTDMLSVKAYPW